MINGDQVPTVTHRDASHIHNLIRQFTKELNQKCHKVKPLGKPYCLAEIFCSERSPLTHQILQIQEGAFRFGYAQGDLVTASGRNTLFTILAQHRLWAMVILGTVECLAIPRSIRSLSTEKARLVVPTGPVCCAVETSVPKGDCIFTWNNRYDP